MTDAGIRSVDLQPEVFDELAERDSVANGRCPTRTDDPLLVRSGARDGRRTRNARWQRGSAPLAHPAAHRGWHRMTGDFERYRAPVPDGRRLARRSGAPAAGATAKARSERTFPSLRWGSAAAAQVPRAAPVEARSPALLPRTRR